MIAKSTPTLDEWQGLLTLQSGLRRCTLGMTETEPAAETG